MRGKTHAFRELRGGTALDNSPGAMRKRYRVLMLATIVAAIAGRFGYALSIEPQPTPVTTYARTNVGASTAATLVASPVLVHTATPTAEPAIDPVPGAGKLLLVGTFLFGLSAIVRKAI